MPEAAEGQDWRVPMFVFAGAYLLDQVAWGHMVAFTPLYLRQDLGVPEAQVPIWAGVLAAAPLAVAVPLSPFSPAAACWSCLSSESFSWSSPPAVLACFSKTASLGPRMATPRRDECPVQPSGSQ